MPPPKRRGDTMLELTFRDLGDSYRLAFYWLREQQRAPSTLGFEEQYEHFDLNQGAYQNPRQLLLHLVCMRINLCLSLEELLFGKIGAHRPWIFARSLAPPGTAAQVAAASRAHTAAAQQRKKERKRSKSASSAVLYQLSISGEDGEDGYGLEKRITDMSAMEREQLGTQVVYWRDRHHAVLQLLWKQSNEGLQPLVRDPLELVPQEWFLELLDNADARGLEPPPFAMLFEDHHRPQPPLYDKDFAAIRPSSTLHCHETPVTLLRKYLEADDIDASLLFDHTGADHRPENALRKLLLDTVLVDFRSTVEQLAYLGPQRVQVPTSRWMPCKPLSQQNNDAARYFLGTGTSSQSRHHASERDAWLQKLCDHIQRKDPSLAGQERVKNLRATHDRRTASIRVGFSMEGAPEAEDVLAERERRQAHFQRVLEAPLWKKRSLGLDADHNYLIVVAVVYRVNHALEQFWHERQQLDQMEVELMQHLEQLGAPLPTPEEMESDEASAASSVDDPLGTKRTNRSDDQEMIDEFVRHVLATKRRILATAAEKEPRSAVEARYRTRIDACLRRMHQWKRFAFSHLHLATLISDADNLCPDSFFLAEDISNHKLSRLTVCYPFPENGWGEEVLQNIRQRVYLADVVHGATTGISATRVAAPSAAPSPSIAEGRRDNNVNTMSAQDDSIAGENPWVNILKKVFPKACSDRDFSSKCDEVCRNHPRIFYYITECLMATLVGLYSDCRNPVCFELALQMFRVNELSRHYSCQLTVEPKAGQRHTLNINPYQAALLDVFWANEELVINSIRENLTWQFHDDPALWMIDANWVLACTTFARMMFQANGNLSGIQEALYSEYSSHGLFTGTQKMPPSLAMSTGDATAPAPQQQQQQQSSSSSSSSALSISKPSIYRVSNKNFTKYLNGLFSIIDTEYQLVSSIASASAGHEKLYVYCLSDAAIDLIQRVVNSTRPGEPLKVVWLKLIGVSEQGFTLFLQAYDMFVRRVHENDVKKCIRALSPLDFELLKTFFHKLKCHMAQPMIPLDLRTAHEQELAIRYRYGVVDPDEPLPAHLMEAWCCDSNGCTELKNYLVPRVPPLFSGFPRVAWDQDKHWYTCTNKKTMLYEKRNENRMQRQESTPGQPAYLEQLRRGDTSAFYGGYVCVDELVRMPEGTRNDSLLEDAVPGVGRLKNAEVKRENNRRDALTQSFGPEILRKLKALESEMRKHSIQPTPQAIYSLEFVPKRQLEALSERQISTLEKLRSELDLVCKQEARRIFCLKTRSPCYELPVVRFPLCGNLLEKNSILNKAPTVTVAICPSCGCNFDFTAKLAYCNGYAPRCFVCNKTHLVKANIGQGIATTEKALGYNRQPVQWHNLIWIDDTSDWMPRAFRICNGCWCEWMRRESMYCTAKRLMHVMYSKTNHTTIAMTRRDRWLPQQYVYTELVDLSKWPSREYADRLAVTLGKQ